MEHTYTVINGHVFNSKVIDDGEFVSVKEITPYIIHRNANTEDNISEKDFLKSLLEYPQTIGENFFRKMISRRLEQIKKEK